MKYFKYELHEEEWCGDLGYRKSRVILNSVEFQTIKIFDQFATEANNKLIVWRKIADGENFLRGQTNDGYTCPQPNAISLGGLPAVFQYNCPVLRVNSIEYNKGEEKDEEK